MRFIQHRHTAKNTGRGKVGHSNLLRWLRALMRKPSHARHYAHAYWHWIHLRPPRLLCIEFCVGKRLFFHPPQHRHWCRRRPDFRPALFHARFTRLGWRRHLQCHHPIAHRPSPPQLHLCPWNYSRTNSGAHTLHAACKFKTGGLFGEWFVFSRCGGVCRRNAHWVARRASVVSRTTGLTLRMVLWT